MLMWWLRDLLYSLLMGDDSPTENKDSSLGADEEIAPELQRQFDSAASHVQSVAGKLDSDTLLYLYARFKQATEGPCQTERPGILDQKARRKYDVWKALERKTRDDAMQEYVQAVLQTDTGWHQDSEAKGGQGFGLKPSRPVQLEEEEEATDTTLLKAVKMGDLQQTTWQLDRRDGVSELCQTDEQGMTPLHWAADRGDPSLIQVLLAKAACLVDAQDADGQTALHFAASCGHAQVVSLLLEARADGQISDNDGLKPIDVADDEEVAKLLAVS